ncbi:MAG: M16 family metallopeptidase [Polyangiaceae bacterium]
MAVRSKQEIEGATYDGSLAFAGGTIERYRLKNGLEILVMADKSAPTVSYFTWYKVGSRHEKAGKTGLAHLFEHLMFNETEQMKAGEFDRKFEESGAETNAATWFDWTYYYESLPADRLPLAIQLESDRMAHLVLREPQVASEKEVVANERRFVVDDSVEGTANELLYKTAFERHPYHWPTIGWMTDILGFSPDDCAAFYKTFYAPNNALIVVVGDLKPRDVVARIVTAYGALPPATIPAEDYAPEPQQIEERRVTIAQPTPTEKIVMGYRGPAFGDADHAALSLLVEVLFGGRASRMHRKLSVELEIATDLKGWVSTFKDPGLVEMYATVREGNSSKAVLHAMDQELERVRRDLVSDDELARAKSRIELSLLRALETAAGKAEQIGLYATVLGDPAGAMTRLDAYRRATAGDLRIAARRHLVDSLRTVVSVTPEDESVRAAGVGASSASAEAS